MEGTIYLLHFAQPISLRSTCQHYLGWCLDLDARLAAHRAGRGARLTQVAVEREITFNVVRTWSGTRDFERTLKNQKRGPKLCPVCCQVHGRRPAVAVNAEQLRLRLFEDELRDFEPAREFPPSPMKRADWYEIMYQRRFIRRVFFGNADVVGATDVDLPF